MHGSEGEAAGYSRNMEMEDSSDKTISTPSSRFVIIPALKSEDNGDDLSEFAYRILIKCRHSSRGRPFGHSISSSRVNKLQNTSMAENC